MIIKALESQLDIVRAGVVNNGEILICTMTEVMI